jgi:hypothetical protein
VSDITDVCAGTSLWLLSNHPQHSSLCDLELGGSSRCVQDLATCASRSLLRVLTWVVVVCWWVWFVGRSIGAKGKSGTEQTVTIWSFKLQVSAPPLRSASIHQPQRRERPEGREGREGREAASSGAAAAPVPGPRVLSLCCSFCDLVLTAVIRFRVS